MRSHADRSTLSPANRSWRWVATPTAIAVVAVLGVTQPATAVAATAPGTVVAWGGDSSGQSTVPTRAKSGVTAVAAGESHSLALKDDGSIVAWGNDDYGQATGPGEATTGFTAISAGAFHSLALRNGAVVAWGATGPADLGQATVPSGLTGVTAIAAGGFHSLALKGDGSVVAWGNNSRGQTDVPSGLAGVTAIAAGRLHNLALKSDGSVVGWGNNDSGQASVPTGLVGVTAIAAGTDHSLALTENGTVVAWGSAAFGRTTVPSGAQAGVTSIAAGIFHSLAITSAGSGVAWGSNSAQDFGQSTVPPALAGVTAIAAGGFHSLAVVGAAQTTISDLCSRWNSELAPIAADPTYENAFISGDWKEGEVITVLIPAGGGLAYMEVAGQGQVGSGTATETSAATFQYRVPADGTVFVQIIKDIGSSLTTQCLPAPPPPPDTSAPVITPIVTGQLGSAGWYTGNAIVSWSVTDPESAVTSQQGCDTVTVSSDTAGATLTCSATSAGGSTSASVTVKRDSAAPVLAPSVSPNPLILGGTATTTAGASDATSGIASSGCNPVPTGIIATLAVACSATDSAGNTSSANTPVQVAAFLGSSGSPAAGATVKSGTTIPVRFTLLKAGGPLNGPDALALLAGNQLRATLTGPGLAAPVLSGPCTYTSTTGQFSCPIKTPKDLRTGSTNAYSLTIQQRPAGSPGTGFFTTPPSTTARPNPQPVFFR